MIAITALVLMGCRPKATAEDVLLQRPDPDCAFEVMQAPLPEAEQRCLHQAGQGIGLTRAKAPALRYVQRQTGDGYLVRRSAANLVMILAGLGVGALIAALLLALLRRRPTVRWADRLGQSINKEINGLRDIAQGDDPFPKAIVTRFDEALELASKKARQLVARAQPLTMRGDSTTAVAHLASLETQLEGLLARIERIHLQLHAWGERQLRAEDEAVKAQVAAAIDELTRAVEELS